MKTILTLFTLCALAVSSTAQTLQFFTPRTVRVTRTADGSTPAARQDVVVIAEPGDVKVTTAKGKNDESVIYRTSDLTVTIKDGKVTFADAKGNVLMTEGRSSFTPITEGVDKGAFKVGQAFSLDADEAIYGLGMLQNGKMDQRGENRSMQQSNLEDYSHFYQTIKGYGIFWDNYSPTQLNTPKEGEAGEVWLESQVGDRMDYFFIYGGNADGVIAEMRHLTGQSPMLPLWTYGFHQSRERYKSSSELLDVVKRYRKLGIPFDGIIQDWQYWGSNYTWNAMEFINDDFLNAQQMIDSVHQMNAHISLSIWASFGPNTKAFKQLNDKGLLFSFTTWPASGLSQWPPRMDYPSGVRCYKPYSQEARDIYWQNLKRLYDMGIDAWWMDSTDPDHLDYKDSDLDEMTAMGSYRSVRNIFPLMSVEGVYNNQMKEETTKGKDAKRPFILTRSYFAGQQRTGANTWSGDVTSSWENLRKQVPLCLNYTLTANPQVNTDLGGFFAGSFSRKGHNSATYNPEYQELYARWMQFGIFCPMMRSHGADVYRELYYYGSNGIKGNIDRPQGGVYNSLVGSVKLRYKLLPYIYSQAWQVSSNDDSFMRALMMDFSDDKNTWNNSREFMFGRSLLVCPVLEPLYAVNGKQAIDWKEMKDYEVYLPQGTTWYDFYTGREIEAGKYTASVNISNIPVFVKAGSIIPLCRQEVTHASVSNWQQLDINVYPGEDASFTLYEDEGDNLNYKDGIYSTIQFTWNDKSSTLEIGPREGSFDGMFETRTFVVKLPDGSSQAVSYMGRPMKVKF